MNLDSLIELTWWWCFCIRNQRRFGVVPMFMQRKRRRFWPIKWLCLIYANRLALRINPGRAKNTFSSFEIYYSWVHFPQPFADLFAMATFCRTKKYC